MELAKKMSKLMLKDTTEVGSQNINNLKLLYAFSKEYKKYKHYLSQDNKNKLLQILPVFFEELNKIDFQKCHVEITQDESIIFDLFLKDDLEYSIELFLNPSEGKERMLFYSVYKGEKYLTNGLTSFSKLIKDINKH